MKIAFSEYPEPPKELIGIKRVSFIAEDGREMFEVTCGKDGKSIEVRGVQTCKVDGVMYSEQLAIEPKVSNDIVVRTIPWDR